MAHQPSDSPTDSSRTPPISRNPSIMSDGAKSIGSATGPRRRGRGDMS